MSSWERVVEFVGQVPPGAWVAVSVANVVVTAATWSAARRRVRRAGERVRRAGERVADGQLMTGRARAKDTALTVAAMVPAALFWVMVLAGSFHGLVAFGRDMVGWRDGWEYLVPGTLDGVSVTFAFLAVRAVRKAKAPDRCRRVVWGAAVASATVNFAYEHADSGGNIVAGGYVGLLSLFGMIMFHEFLDQFEEGAGQIRRANPAFGLRWITWPTNTLCAAVAWHNHPPTEDTAATVRNAVANLDRVRTLKREARQAAVVARHERALAVARRKTELAAATAGHPGPAAGRYRHRVRADSAGKAGPGGGRRRGGRGGPAVAAPRPRQPAPHRPGDPGRGRSPGRGTRHDRCPGVHATGPRHPAGGAATPIGVVLPWASLAGQVGVSTAASDGRLVVRLSTPQRGDYYAPTGDLPAYRLSASVVPPGLPARTLRLRGRGEGCFVAAVAWAAADNLLALRAAASGWTGGTVSAVLPWPVRPAPERLAAAVAAMAAVDRLTVYEAVTSDTSVPLPEPVALSMSGRNSWPPSRTAPGSRRRWSSCATQRDTVRLAVGSRPRAVTPNSSSTSAPGSSRIPSSTPNT